jgi:hypothetical protein
MIPVEPEQDNACAGKVAVFSSSALHFPTFPPNPVYLKLEYEIVNYFSDLPVLCFLYTRTGRFKKGQQF